MCVHPAPAPAPHPSPSPLHTHPQLTLPPGSITTRFEALACLLPVASRSRLGAACARRPQLLAVSMQRLAGCLMGLAELLGTPLEVMVECVWLS